VKYAIAGDLHEIEEMISAGVDVNAANNVMNSHKCIPEFRVIILNPFSFIRIIKRTKLINVGQKTHYEQF
jgi:hypothetical protein